MSLLVYVVPQLAAERIRIDLVADVTRLEPIPEAHFQYTYHGDSCYIESTPSLAHSLCESFATQLHDPRAPREVVVACANAAATVRASIDWYLAASDD